MNIRKIGVYNKETTYIDQKPIYTSMNKIFGYKGRGYTKRVGRIGISRTIINNPTIAKHVKRNRAYNLVYISSAGGACEIQ